MPHPSKISIKDYTYQLPSEKIANFPLEKREDSKLLIYQNASITESRFDQIEKILPQNSVLIFNNTKVVTARLYFETAQKHQIEVFCLSPANGIEPSTAMQMQGNLHYLCLVGNLKKWKEETLTSVKNDIKLQVKIIRKNEADFELAFSWSPENLHFSEILSVFGELPIPPYLNRKSNALDAERYQTVYAAQKGSVAAPTAGLHFTPSLLKKIQSKGINAIQLTLHVSAGTFKPVKSAQMDGHTMHAEWMNLSLESITLILEVINKTIICVGTTSLRALESLYWMGLKVFYQPTLKIADIRIKQWDVYDLKLKEISTQESLTALIKWMKKNKLDHLCCETQILIAPPYKLKLAKGILTNFHQPESTLLLLVAAIVGDEWKSIYNYALQNEFRFLSYGDASLLLK